jgi:hypothetical protein
MKGPIYHGGAGCFQYRVIGQYTGGERKGTVCMQVLFPDPHKVHLAHQFTFNANVIILFGQTFKVCPFCFTRYTDDGIHHTGCFKHPGNGIRIRDIDLHIPGFSSGNNYLVLLLKMRGNFFADRTVSTHDYYFHIDGAFSLYKDSWLYCHFQIPGFGNSLSYNPPP